MLTHLDLGCSSHHGTIAVEALMTPRVLLRVDNLPPAQMILPDVVQSFQDILMRRHEIRRLRLLPIKTDSARKNFKELDHDRLHEQLLVDLKGCSIGVAPNSYPYFLPDDVLQLIVWIPKRELAYRDVAKFIDKVIRRCQVTPENIVMFERPHKSSQLLIRGTFPAMRHVHLWLPR
jgi:hypothetical protein